CASREASFYSSGYPAAQYFEFW
nr:immunoglobulin heavy chain junction region [Macaca mulatta]MOX05564.1 immunoglobulin heavy chain junction region [Macaca mulatta]